MYIKREEYVNLNNRSDELEELLCPCAQHQWVRGEEEYVRTSIDDSEIGVNYRCKKCKKKRLVLKKLEEEWRDKNRLES